MTAAECHSRIQNGQLDSGSKIAPESSVMKPNTVNYSAGELSCAARPCAQRATENMLSPPPFCPGTSSTIVAFELLYLLASSGTHER